MQHHLNLPLLSIASALLATAVGASYAYVDLSLNRMGVSATAIGMNAAMPALGWLLATPLMPWALRRFNSKTLLLGLLAVAIVAILGFPAMPDPDAWMVLRFLFGGGTGMVFRLVEYWINAASPESRRARNVGIYATAFCAGAMIGAAAVPVIGLDGWPPVMLMAGVAMTALAALAMTGGGPPVIADIPASDHRSLSGTGGIAVLGALVFGLFEAVPYTLLPVYAVRLGLAEDWAAATASAFLLGILLFSVPMGWGADRFGKTRVLALNAITALAITAIIPQTQSDPLVLLSVMMLWGGSAGSLYNVALAMLADRFRGSGLAAANASFGTLYAVGSLCGPPLHGLAMDWHDPQGLMISAAILFGLFLCILFWHSWRAWGAIWTAITKPSPD